MKTVSERARGAEGELTRLTAVSRALTLTDSLDEVLEITVQCAADLLNASRVVLMLVHEDGLLRVHAGQGLDPGTVARFREPLDEGLVERLGSLLGPEAQERFLGVPLFVRGRVTGLLAILRPAEGPHTRALEREEWLPSALADQASVALEGLRRQEAMAGLEERLEELQRLSGLRETAIRMVGHDLRSPINALQGYVQLLLEGVHGPLSDGQRSSLKRMERIGRHLGGLVSNVLEMSRIADGTVEVSLVTVGVERVARAVVEMLELRAKEGMNELRLEIQSPLEALADEERLTQVLLQLVDNALKYSPDGGVVTIRGAREAGPGCGANVVLRVSDEGPGIPPELREEIFQPYRRLDGVGTDGVGLGLAIARSLAELMGGSIGMEGGEGPGATFALRLPAPEADPLD